MDAKYSTVVHRIIRAVVVADSAEFWEELASISPRTRKVVDAFKKYSAVMEKAGVPYRYS